MAKRCSEWKVKRSVKWLRYFARMQVHCMGRGCKKRKSEEKREAIGSITLLAIDGTDVRWNNTSSPLVYFHRSIDSKQPILLFLPFPTDTRSRCSNDEGVRCSPQVLPRTAPTRSTPKVTLQFSLRSEIPDYSRLYSHPIFFTIHNTSVFIFSQPFPRSLFFTHRNAQIWACRHESTEFYLLGITTPALETVGRIELEEKGDKEDKKKG